MISHIKIMFKDLDNNGQQKAKREAEWEKIINYHDERLPGLFSRLVE